MQQLKLELAGYQSCCKRLGDDLAAKDRELEGLLAWNAALGLEAAHVFCFFG